MAILAIVFDKDVGRFLAQTIGSDQIRNQSIVSAKLGAGVVGTPHLANQSVVSGKIGAGVIGGPHIKDADTFPGLVFDGIVSARDGITVGARITVGSYYGYWSRIEYRSTNPNPDDMRVYLSARLSGEGAVIDTHSFTRWGGLDLLLSGNMTLPGQVDSVDISAHTHTGGAGDTPNIQSGGIGASQIGTPHLANQAITSALVAAGILATPHMQNQGILSASLALGVIGGAHVASGTTFPPFNVSGKVGIGIASSAATLHVRPQGSDVAVLTVESTYPGTTTPISFIGDSPGDVMSLVIQKGAGYRPPGYVSLLHLDMAGNIDALASGNIATAGWVDSVDVSAHTHTGGAGDAGVITSAGVGALAVGTPHIANQGILSAALGLLAVGTPHIAPSAVASGQLASGQVGSPHLYFSGMVSNYLLLRGASEWQVWNPVLILVPGDVTIAAADTTKSNNTTTPTKVKEIVVGWHGTYRIYFQLQCGASDGSTRGQIYRNGAAVGTQRAPSGGGYTAYTEDIAGWSPGDKAQLYLWNAVSATPTNFAQYFRIQGTQVSKDRINGIRVDLD